jgi:hypothetical protein
MNIQPLKQKHYDKAKELNIEKIIFSFSGGSDEGYLEVYLYSRNILPREARVAFTEDLEEWAWSVWEYSGAGIGREYGDNIEYNILDMVANSREWWLKEKIEDVENDVPIQITK